MYTATILPAYAILLTAVVALLVAVFGNIQVVVSAAFTIWSITASRTSPPCARRAVYPRWVSVAVAGVALALSPRCHITCLGLLGAGLGVRWAYRARVRYQPGIIG